VQKRAYGPWMLGAFRVLAKLRGLRGTAFDIFGRTAERRMERQLIAEYEGVLDEIAAGLTSQNHGLAVELAALPMEIRGFGHIKEANRLRAKAKEADLLARFRAPPPRAMAAE
jgi:indolepyruvate ferredoxin oxidoreductase